MVLFGELPHKVNEYTYAYTHMVPSPHRFELNVTRAAKVPFGCECILLPYMYVYMYVCV